MNESKFEDNGLTRFCRWQFDPTGDFAEDCRTGRHLAREYLTFQDDDFFAQSLGSILTAITRKPREVSSLELAFFREIAAHLVGVDVARDGPTLRIIDGGKS